ncbi:MAG: class I SAM-dependent methyltransferase [Deltaproteobacteria bacterium]|nr:class I SAM-dependent methyltransferase [Deltaproteobacteria bacterium]
MPVSSAAERDVLFWNRKADRYPLPFDDTVMNQTAEIVSRIKAMGGTVKGKQLLDIGCGTGVYTLPLAAEAQHVMGLDISETMLARLKCEVDNRHIYNVDVIKADWSDLDIETLGLVSAFDVVWAAMTPALRGQDNLLKMDRCSREWCVYIGWGRIRENELMEKVFQAHGLSLQPPPGAFAAHALLEKQGRRPQFEVIDTEWEWTGTIDEAVDDMTAHLERLGASVQPDVVQKIVGAWSVNGEVRHITRAEQGIVVWRTDS